MIVGLFDHELSLFAALKLKNMSEILKCFIIGYKV